MSHKKVRQHDRKAKTKRSRYLAESAQPVSRKTKRPLELVLKCDSAGTVEAVRESIAAISVPDVPIEIIHAGVGIINKSDIFLAESGSRLIVGFNVDVMPKIGELLKRYSIEIRLYEVIYKLLEDLQAIAESLIPFKAAPDQTLGTAKVIALFKSSRKGIILGCEVQEGHLALGQQFRVISAMGPVYTGRIESLHIEKDAVQKATVGQQVGLKINDFNKVEVGYLVESFSPQKQRGPKPWEPRGEVVRA